MSRHQYQSKKRHFVSSIETLDDRVLLNAGTPVPATPAPAPSPFSMAQVRRFERDVNRIDREFLQHSKQLNAFVMRRTAQVENMLAAATSRAQVKVQQTLATTSTIPAASLATQDQALNTQLGREVASFNTRVTQLNDAFEQQFGILANSFAKAGARFGIPATAFENNLQSARFGFSTGLTNAVNSITAQVQNQTSSLSNLLSNPSSVLSQTGTSQSGTTGTTGAGTTSTTGTGTIMTQVFNNAFTQDFSTIDATINSVDSQLQQGFGAFETQFTNNVGTLISTFNATPFGTFQPTVSFVPGNGVTFTSTGSGTGTVQTTTSTTGTVGTIATTTGTGTTTTGTTTTGTTGTTIA